MRFKITANETVTLNLRFTGQFLQPYLFVFVYLDDLTVLNDDVYRSVFNGFDIFFDLCKRLFSDLFRFRHLSLLSGCRSLKDKKRLRTLGRSLCPKSLIFSINLSLTSTPDSFIGYAYTDLAISTTNSSLTTCHTGLGAYHHVCVCCSHNQISFPLRICLICYQVSRIICYAPIKCNSLRYS